MNRVWTTFYKTTLFYAYLVVVIGVLSQPMEDKNEFSALLAIMCIGRMISTGIELSSMDDAEREEKNL